MTIILTTHRHYTGLTLLGVLLAPGLAAGDLDDPRRAVEGGLEQVLGLVIVEAAERVRDGGLGHGAVQTLDVWRHALPALLDSIVSVSTPSGESSSWYRPGPGPMVSWAGENTAPCTYY